MATKMLKPAELLLITTILIIPFHGIGTALKIRIVVQQSKGRLIN